MIYRKTMIINANELSCALSMAFKYPF